jgi:hypothetical protein
MHYLAHAGPCTRSAHRAGSARMRHLAVIQAGVPDRKGQTQCPTQLPSGEKAAQDATKASL